MVFKVNYGLERAERNRAKLAKKEAKSLARKANSDGSAHDNPVGQDDDAGARPAEIQEDK